MTTLCEKTLKIQ